MNTGYWKELSRAERRTNEIASIRMILREYPDNQYWQMRLAALLEVEPICCCFEIAGDNKFCPMHGEPEGSDNTISGQWREHGYY